MAAAAARFCTCVMSSYCLTVSSLVTLSAGTTDGGVGSYLLFFVLGLDGPFEGDCAVDGDDLDVVSIGGEIFVGHDGFANLRGGEAVGLRVGLVFARSRRDSCSAFELSGVCLCSACLCEGLRRRRESARQTREDDCGRSHKVKRKNFMELNLSRKQSFRAAGPPNTSAIARSRVRSLPSDVKGDG